MVILLIMMIMQMMLILMILPMSSSDDVEDKDRPKLGISASDLCLSTKANLKTIIVIINI